MSKKKDFIKDEVHKRQNEKVVVEYCCSICGDSFNLESECDEHIASCVQNTLSAHDPLEVNSNNNKVTKRKVDEYKHEKDPTSLFEESTSEDSSDDENVCKKRKKSININLKEEHDNVTLENPAYGATSQMLSDNEMLITLPYDQDNEVVNEPLDFANEIDIGYEEHSEDLNNFQIEYKPHTRTENHKNDSNSLIIENFDTQNLNINEQTGGVKILSMLVTQPPQKRCELNTIDEQRTQKNEVSIEGTAEILENEKNDNNADILSVLNTLDVNQLVGNDDEEIMLVIDVPSPAEAGEGDTNSELRKEIECESDDENENCESGEVENTRVDSEENEDIKPINQKHDLQLEKMKNKRITNYNKKVHQKNIPQKKGSLESKSLIKSMKQKFTQNVIKSKIKEEEHINGKQNENNKIKPQKNQKELQHQEERLKYMYQVILKTEEIIVEEPRKPRELSVYEFYDEEDEKLKEKIKEEVAKEKALKARTCKFCNEIFDDPMDVLRHKRQSHKFKRINMSREELEPYFQHENHQECPLCFKKLGVKPFKSVYLKHLMTHCNEYDFTCKVCGMPFRRKDHLANHEARHVVPPENF